MEQKRETIPHLREPNSSHAASTVRVLLHIRTHPGLQIKNCDLDVTSKIEIILHLQWAPTGKCTVFTSLCFYFLVGCLWFHTCLSWLPHVMPYTHHSASLCFSELIFYTRAFIRRATTGAGNLKIASHAIRLRYFYCNNYGKHEAVVMTLRSISV